MRWRYEAQIFAEDIFLASLPPTRRGKLKPSPEVSTRAIPPTCTVVAPEIGTDCWARNFSCICSLPATLSTRVTIAPAASSLSVTVPGVASAADA